MTSKCPMTDSLSDHNEVDRALLGWALVWSFALTATIAAILHAQPNNFLPNGTGIALALAMGGLSATWTLIGTWALLIHLPAASDAPAPGGIDSGNTDSGNTVRQRMRPQIAVMLVWLTNVAILAMLIRQEHKLLTQVLVTALAGIMLSVIAFQWTQQRIRRESVFVPKKRSIRQLLGVATTIALLIALMQWSHRWLGASGSLSVLVASTAVLWIVMLSTILGRWWGLVFLTIPAVIVQWFVVSSWVDIMGRDGETQVRQFSGTILGFYIFSLMFLMLMRSSGHRWPGSLSVIRS